ncbi:MAG: formylglycine-generating enzyme family protein, partial [Anaerolineae bacterium]|nr:formylglycine-generating enzyme family protein [Anaerolineae bacterium]
MRTKPHIFYGILLTSMILGGLVALKPTTAQSGPDSYETAQAAVEQLFTATAQASAYSTFSLTVDILFQQAQTATAEAASPATSAPGSAATETDAARILTATAASAATGTAFFESPQAWAEGIRTETLRVDGGTFEMGTTPQEVTAAVQQCVEVEGGNCQIAFGEDSAPPHAVTVSGFAMEQTEVTYGQYLAFLNTLGAGAHLNGCDGQRCVYTQGESESSNIFFEDGRYRVLGVIDNFPVANVTWYGADAYCRAIGRRLPTEAEWERAARGNGNWIYPWGNEWNPAFAKTSISPDESVGALPVGSFGEGRSSSGIFDLAGNVAEWVSDWYDPTFYTNPVASGLDPQGPSPSGDLFQKVVRGGSWDAKPFFARSVHRQSATPQSGYAWLGFRCVG